MIPLLLAAFLLLGPPHARAGDAPFTGPSNIGLTGLLEIPTARAMPAETIRAGFTRVDPYRYYFVTVSPFDRIEINGRLTEVSGVPGFTNFAAYGDFKDKAVDLKLQLVAEGKYAPALALAVLDPHGTRVYASQLLVASKQVHPFDFTVGLGNGRFGDRPLPATGDGFRMEMFGDPKAWWRDARLFGGIAFAPFDTLALSAEYSPIAYHAQESDPARDRYFRRPVSSRFNFGLRVKPLSWAELDLSYQRGNQVGVSFSAAFDAGKPFIPIYDPPYRESPSMRGHPLEDRVAAALHASGFSDIGVASDGTTLRIEAQNDRYFFTPRAVEEILSILSRMEPESHEYVRIVVKDNGIPIAEAVTTGREVADLADRERRAGRLPDRLAFVANPRPDPAGRTVHRRWFDYGARPSLETFLNDPSNFFSYRFGLSGWLSARPWTGATLLSGVEWYPLNNVTTSNEPLSIPVRSDIAAYKRESASLGRLLFDQAGRLGGGLFGRLSAGLLETQYAGLDGEAAIPLLDGRVLLGAGGSLVRKRDPDSPFRIGRGEFHTGFLSARLNVVEWDLHADLKAGRFLAGDPGASLTVSKFINGLVLSAWYTVTDTSVFRDDSNRGYHDKGISASIPLRMFTGRDSKTAFLYKLAPWTRDAGQDIDHYRTLFDLIGRNTPLLLDKDRKNLYKMEKMD